MKTALLICILLLAYGVVGRMDYDDAVAAQQPFAETPYYAAAHQEQNQ